MTLQELRAGQQASGAQLLLLSGLLDELGSSSLQEVATPAVLQAVSLEASSLPRSLAPSALAKVLTATVRSVLCVQQLVSKVFGYMAPALSMRMCDHPSAAQTNWACA